jgi:hypothetical protein
MTGAPSSRTGTLRQATAAGWFFVAIGVGFLAAFVYNFCQTREFVRTAKHAPGRVVDLEPRRGSSGGHDLYVTVFKFADDSGQGHTVRTSFAQYPPSHKVGDSIMVLYLPGNADDARIQSFTTLWFFTTLFGAMGAGSATVGAFAVVMARKTYGGAESS